MLEHGKLAKETEDLGTSIASFSLRSTEPRAPSTRPRRPFEVASASGNFTDTANDEEETYKYAKLDERTKHKCIYIF